MLLSRRVPLTWSQAVRLAVWPRHSWRRSMSYARLRLARVRGRPRHLALGVAVGVFVAILPIPGLQLLAAAALAWLVGGHGGAAALATFAANPITYPIFWVSSYLLGARLLGAPAGNAAHDIGKFTDAMAHALSPADGQSVSLMFASVWPTVAKLFLGALPLAALAALASYAVTSRLLRRHAVPLMETRPRHTQRARVARRTAPVRKTTGRPLKAAA